MTALTRNTLPTGLDIGQRLESSDGGVAGAWVVAEPVDDPSDLVPTAVRVVVEAGGVAVGVAEFGYTSGIVKVRVHPGQAFGAGESFDDRVGRLWLVDDERQLEHFEHGFAVPAARGA